MPAFCKLVFNPSDRFSHFRQLAHHRINLSLLVNGFCGASKQDLIGSDIACNTRLGSDLRPVSDMDVILHSNLTSQNHIVPGAAAACDAYMAQIKLCLPMVQLWAICTRLSILVPVPMRVTP